MLNLDRQHQLIISHALLLCHSEFLMSCGLGRSSVTLMPIHEHEHDNVEQMHGQAVVTSHWTLGCHITLVTRDHQPVI
jgi:hypothetical protein